METYSISIIGSGIVGTATGKGFHKLGHNVTFFDISKQRLLALKEEGYSVASSLSEAIFQSEISFVCVNTPPTNRGNSLGEREVNTYYNNKNTSFNYGSEPVDEDLGKHQDLSQLLSALRDIAQALNNNTINRKHLLVFRSTMLPGTMKNIVVDYLDRNCVLKRGIDYNVCNNPEFLRQQSALEDFFAPDRVLIGEDVANSSLPLSDLYSPLTKNIIVTGYEEAEMVKYASNCFLALKISYFNQISTMCRTMGINEEQVSLAVSLDKRIGNYGTKGGRPFAGACFPKDTEAFASFANKLNVKPDLVETAISINNQLNSAKQYVKEHIYEKKAGREQYLTE